MTPKTIDWGMWLGHKFDFNGEPLGPSPEGAPFDRAVWAQWRCYWPFGGGMFTDLFVHQTTHLITAMGVQLSRLWVVRRGRIVYGIRQSRRAGCHDRRRRLQHEGCQVIISATMCNDASWVKSSAAISATIRFGAQQGRRGSDYVKGFEVFGQDVRRAGPSKPKEGFAAADPHLREPDERSKVLAMRLLCGWENFLQCVHDRNRETLCTPELGAAAFSTVNMGVLSYRQGKVLFWDKSKRLPVEADTSWASKLEARSKKRDKPSQIIGWQGGDAGDAYWSHQPTRSWKVRGSTGKTPPRRRMD